MADFVRISIQGELPGGEKWSVNPIFRFTTPLALSSAECSAMATAINQITMPGPLGSFNPASVKIMGTRVEARRVDGSLDAVAEVARTTPFPGTSSANHPLQTSIVLSLRSVDSTQRGKGRLYWPALGFTLNGSTMRFSPTDVTSFLTTMNSYLAAIRAAIRTVGGATTAALAVWSRTDLDTKIVIELRAGDVPDTQRRRRDKLIESYQSVAVV